MLVSVGEKDQQIGPLGPRKPEHVDFGLEVGDLRDADLGQPQTVLLVDVLHYSEEGLGTFAEWYEGLGGQLVSVLGLAALVAGCYFLAKKGAKWQLEEEADSE